jgi:ribose 5-phosphate isomerase B
MDKETIWIGSDHCGLDIKLRCIDRLQKLGLAVHDVGTNSAEFVRYPYYAARVAGAVARGEARRGILICGTGIGMSMIANKFKGVRASLCTSTYMGRMTRAHNDSNILCLGGKITGEWEAIDILEAWLNTEYMGGRHEISVGLIREAEESIGNPEGWRPTGPEKK